ncbi:right-handed parallel beta-helix repeat-containing protein [bacterium]|nr:right-handed parallel beta-helix repeat-containing protein [bacterium]
MRINVNVLLVISIIVLVTFSVSAQNFHYVPDDFETISEAISAAASGDFVIVRDGVYSGSGNVNLDPQGKALVIQSENGPGSCFIECGKNHQAFILKNGEDRETVIRGFMIQHGYAVDFGGAILCLNSSPVIDDCHFENNHSEYGAAIAAINGDPQITNCHFFNNNAVMYGAAVFFANSSAVLSDCYLAWNFAEAGGGVYCCWFAKPKIINTLFIWNSADRGGAICAEFMGFPELVNCTLSDNNGSGVFCQWSNCVITNSILYGNNPEEIDCPDADPAVTYSCIKGGIKGVGNIDEDPLFVVGSQGEYYLGAPEMLEPNPCVDAGSGLAEEICWTVGSDMVCLDEYTTQVDMSTDMDIVDLGYHCVDHDDCIRFGSRFLGPETDPDSGDLVGLEIAVCNPGIISHIGLNLFIIMEESGEFWFWPSWSSSDWMTVDVAPGVTTWTIFAEEPWTEPAPYWFNNVFYGALTNSSITEIVGEIGLFPYRFDM